MDALLEGNDDESLQNLILCEPDVENMQKALKDKAKSLKKLCAVNLEMKTQLQNRLEIYEQAMA